MYDETMVAPMRKEVTDMGGVELRTAADVESQLMNVKEPTLVFVNSVCGCAAGGARPGLALALQHSKLPAKMTTVFAGQDTEATAAARSLFVGYMPSSPQIALLKGGKCVAMMERHDIEGRMPVEIANALVQIFEKHC